MNSKYIATAAQLGPLPTSLTKQMNAKSLFSLYQNGEAIELIKQVDVEEIKKYSFSRIEALVKEASKNNSQLIVFPELTLTSFFPYFYIEDQTLLSRFFETEDSLKLWTEKIKKLAKKYKIAISWGCAELTADGNRFNSSMLIDTSGNVYTYRKTHIPGFSSPFESDNLFQFEKHIFQASTQGYPVFDVELGGANTKLGMIICHDRRYNGPYLSMGLQGVNVVLNGYNTPFNLSFEQSLDEHVYKFHYLPMQAQSITEGIYIISVARAGESFGVNQIAGSCIISPFGDILVKSENLTEELLHAEIDLANCNKVKAQKYWGTRSNPHALLSDLQRIVN